MSTWTRATVEVACGKCGQRIGVGQPLLTRTAKLPYTGTFIRCPACAGGTGAGRGADGGDV